MTHNPTPEQLAILSIGGDFLSPPYSMFSGQAEAVAHTYNIHIGKSGRIWLVSTEAACAGNIYVQGGPKSDGFGGATLSFTLANGCDKISLHGPRHSNCESLFSDTGIDVRNRHLVYGVIGKGRDWKDGRSIIKDLIYFDEKPTIGPFNRIKDKAEALAESLNQQLYYYTETKGGSSCGPTNFKVKS